MSIQNTAMKNSTLFRSLLIIGLLLTITNCKKDEIQNLDTLNKLYEKYEDGEISECKYNGELVYTAQMNVYDAETVIFDVEGNQIGMCNYAPWGTLDAICFELEDCEVIYRVEDNIWGQAHEDKYGIGN